MSYVLPNRKAFSDFVTRIFLKYRDKGVDADDADEDLCTKQTNKNTRELFSYQKLVQKYLETETPYRGLLLYHGLGSGKTCSSIAVAESLMTSKKIYVLTPASLKENYLQEIRKCGDPMYAYEQHWEERRITTEADRALAKSLGISDTYLDMRRAFYVTVNDRAPNFKELPNSVMAAIRAQIEDVINQRFTFINYNGLSSANVDKILPPDQPNMFDNACIIIDEAHNLIGNVVNDRAIKRKLYDMLYNSKDSKIVALSGTPIINRPNEIAFLLNLLKGPIERISVAFKTIVGWDEEAMTKFYYSLPDVDTVEYNSIKKKVMLTRNPPHFATQYNAKGERISVKYDKAMPYTPSLQAWVGTWKTKYQTAFPGNELGEPESFVVEALECLPSKYEEFVAMFVDGLNIKNPILFQRRIQGLVSYYRGADDRLLPKRVDEETTLQKIPMSGEQFTRYLEVRWDEIKRESRKGMRPNMDEDYGSFRMTSRLVCNYAVPSELRTKEASDEGSTEDTPAEKSEILEALKRDPGRYLVGDALASHSPKFARILNDLKTNAEGMRNQFVYSQYLTLEGLGVFAAILDANGFQEYKLQKTPAGWAEDPSMDASKPAYALFSGENKDERELLRQIFNGIYNDTFPQSLKDSLADKPKRLCVFMASAAGAEGITLANVRNVYIMEPYWNPARIDQVIGRAIRICSHAKLPMDERTVKVNLYMSVFSPEQATTAEAPNIVSIRRNDMVLKRYEGEQPRETFMTSDEFLYETAFEKSRLTKQFSHLLKQAAVDCEIHRKLHAKEQPVIQCMRFDSTATPDELGFKPAVLTEERDTMYRRNMIRTARRLQRVLLKGIPIILDPDTREIFDAPLFDDSKRLVQIGELLPPNQVRFFPQY